MGVVCAFHYIFLYQLRYRAPSLLKFGKNGSLDMATLRPGGPCCENLQDSEMVD